MQRLGYAIAREASLPVIGVFALEPVAKQLSERVDR
jgi:hypothetical protein